MAEGISQPWREWVPMTSVLEQLPQHFQQGVDTSNLQITCIASLTKHLVLGTNVGIVYLAHLPTPSLMRLKCENPLSPITNVETVTTVDEMIAAGSLDGTITIFQIPRAPAMSGIESHRGITLAQPVIKRFTVGSIHRTRITSMTWSRNGMKLFCGDAQGVVSQIDINYQTSECTAKEVLKEEYVIVQLSYSHQLLSVSTLERTLLYNLTNDSIQQVGKKPRKHQGTFGCMWSRTSPQTSPVLYTSRPGLRVWSVNREGEVQQTHIIKELPENAQVQLLESSREKPRKGENFSFGILKFIDSYLVAHNSHWLFIVDIDNLKVCNYCGEFGRIIDVAISEKEIFVLDGSRHITCLSREPPDIGEKRPTLMGPAAFLESSNLKEIKSRIVTQSTGFIDQIARIGSSVAAKVSEQAKPTIVAGHDWNIKPKPPVDSHVDKSDSCGMGSVQPTTLCEGRERGHQRSSSSEVFTDQPRVNSPNLIPPRMVQSVSSFIPSLLSTPSLVKTFGKTPHLTDVPTHSESVTNNEFEEVVTSAQIVAEEGAELEPLVLRDKPKRKVKKKSENASPDIRRGNKTKQIDANTSNKSSRSSSPLCTTPHSGTSTEKSTPENVNLLNQVGKQLGYDIDENSRQDLGRADDNLTDRADFESKDYTIEPFRLEGLDPKNMDTRTDEDYKSDVQKNESLLADILDLECLRMDHEDKCSETETNDATFRTPLVIDRAQSVESGGCSTPSTLKEQSPLPDSTSNDFLEQYYRNNRSFGLAEEDDEPSCRKKETSNDDSCNDSIASNDGCERLGSNFSEDRLSCLSYGPPSGSSLVSLPGIRMPSVEGHDPYVNECGAMHIVTDSSDIADVSWSYSSGQQQDSLLYDREEMPGGWVKHKLPSNVISFSVSEKMVVFLDSHSCLFCKLNSVDSCWRKFKLTAKASQIVQSSAGSILWVLYGTHAYTVPVPSLEALPSAKMTLAAKNVLHLSADENDTWYIRGDHQVCVIPNKGGRAPCLVSCDDFRLVKIVCHTRVVWGLTDKGLVAFRIGMNSQSKTGHAWGLMKSPGMPVKDIALGPGNLGWVIDADSNIYFRPGVCAEYPQGRDLKWWQIATSDYMTEHDSDEQGSVILRVSSEGIWLTEMQSNSVFLHNNEITGHVWNTFTNDHWSTICSEGVYTDQGAISCLTPKGQLFVINPNTKSSVPLEVANQECIVSASQRPEAMWVLTAVGDVYIRVGLSAQSLLGTRWEQLDLHQISDIHLCHLSCGTEVVWGVDTQGGVYMRQGPLTPPPFDSLPPAWIQVEQVPLKGNAIFTKVYVGMKTHMVWGIDSSRRVYVREAIFPEIPIGISWVLVPGLLAQQLSISETEVFALTPNGEIFKRTGVTEINYIGDTWEKIPGKLNKISVTTDNRLWGLSRSNQIYQHEVLLWTDPLCSKLEASADIFHSDEGEDWEML